jgi:uncharacterized protein YcfJ
VRAIVRGEARRRIARDHALLPRRALNERMPGAPAAAGFRTHSLLRPQCSAHLQRCSKEQEMRAFGRLTVGFAAILASASAFAYQGPEYDTADVVSVDPIIEQISEPIDREVCWSEPVTYREPVRRPRSNSGAVLGAIVGGVIGNQFGSGHGRDAATVAGAALGYSVARDEQRRNDRYYGRYSERVVRTEERRCRIETDYREEERVLGYDVAYRYNGRVYHTRTDSHPGDTIRVRVDIEAVN